MLRIALGTLNGRKGGMLGAYAAVALAVVLVVSSGILLESSLRAPLPVERLAGADVVVQADTSLSAGGDVSVLLPERARLPEGLADRLAAVPGVHAAVADRSFAVTGADGASLTGHGWSSAALTPLHLVAGAPPRGAGDVVLDAASGSGVGDRVEVATAAGRRVFTVRGLVPASSQDAAFFRDDVAQTLSGSGSRADLVGLVAAPGVDVDQLAGRVRNVLDDPSVRVLTGAKRREAESLEATLGKEDVIAGLTSFGVFAALVAVFVVASAFSLSVQQRHRELALFRAIGTTPLQVRRMVAGEALLISVLAAAVGAVPGVLLAFGEKRLFADVHMLPHDLDLVVGPLPFVVGLLVAVLTTQIAAFASARRASRIRPVDALREAAVERRPVSWLRGLAGLGAFGAGLAILLVSAGGPGSGDDAPASAFVWVAAAALLGPLLALPFVWLAGPLVEAIGRGPGMLARANTRANLRRVASVATPLTLTIALAFTILFSRTTLERQTAEQAERSIAATHVLMAAEGPGLAPHVAAAARRAPGVGRASGTFATSVLVAADGANLTAFPARAVDAATLGGVVDLGVTSGSLDRLHGDAVAVGVERAKQLGWAVGDRVALWLGDGTPARLRVVATYDRPLGFGDVVLPRALAAVHVTDALDDAVFVRGAPGVREADLERSLEGLAARDSSVDVATRSAYLDMQSAAAREQSLIVYLLMGIVVLFAAVAVVNALTMAIAERTRELALLRLVGASRRQVTRMIRGETLLTAAFGIVLGAVVALPGLAVFSAGLTGNAVPDVPAWMLAAVVGGATVLALAAAVVPTRLALRADPVAALGARE
jgi:putative ABC transport system permease protein